MKIRFLGGTREVGKSAVLLEEQKTLLDCGIKLGKEIGYPELEGAEFEKVGITHAHLDHVGYLPHLFKKGRHVEIYGTKPTKDLAGVLLSDYRRISKSFSEKDVEDVIKNFHDVEYGEKKAGMEFFNAGHIMGSAMIRVGDLLYTGDLNVRGTRLLNGAELGLEAKTLIIEGTYGNEDMPSRKETERKFINEIKETLDNGGHVLIPSFAVGRGQEVLFILENYIKSGVLPDVKIYVEGMIKKALRIYRKNVLYGKEEIWKRILINEEDPFRSRYFHSSRRKDKEDVFEEPSIIVSTSGMLTGGPVLGYLKRMASNPKNKIIFVGYQAEGTRGREVVEGKKNVEVDDEEVELKMKIAEVRLSAHAGRNELISFVKGIKGLKRVFLMHGDEGALESLKEGIGKRYDVNIPELGDQFIV
ncbi:MBL fold metallo-hydrolase [Candidatus Micrarchaeota archaeon]|nr:MBL fold metallo-hydrolase [Candidatus Micrarchaeota archaeon]